MVLPLSLKPYVTMKMTEAAFTLNGYLIIISIYFIIGIITLIISEKIYLGKGV